MPVIEVSHVTKEFRLGAMHGLKETLLNAGARLSGKPVAERPLFKALDDVSFSIEAGEVVGIIGHNGAGKSTLLKILAGISQPSHGSAVVHGRVAPLIEVGAGFVPDFTGRENVYLNGSILGLKRQEIERKFDEIVDFAEMAEFIDTPVKRYSSGMQVKLAFAVATSIDAEILIVDEVLAVGDLAFQRKCFDRMEDLIKRQGRTVLLVSHNIRQVERLCSRVLLLDQGALMKDGSSTEVCNAFIYLMNQSIEREKGRKGAREIQNSGEITSLEVAIDGGPGRARNTLKHNQAGGIRIVAEFATEVRDVAVYIGIHTTDFVYLTNNNTAYSTHTFSPGRHTIQLDFDAVTLVPGAYAMLLWIGTPAGKVTYHAENLVTFIVESDDFAVSRQQGQAVFVMPGEWSIDGQRKARSQAFVNQHHALESASAERALTTS